MRECFDSGYKNLHQYPTSHIVLFIIPYLTTKVNKNAENSALRRVMNTLFAIFITISLSLLLFGNPSALLASVGVAGGKAIAISASLAGIYAFWMGIIKIVEKTPAISKLERLISPVVKRIFPETSVEVRKLICLNISANMLGAGGGATPLAISAIKQMQTPESKKTARATKPMLMLFILNATSLQLIPTTVISLRNQAGSTSPSSILIPTTIASIIATVVGVWLVGVLEKDV